MSTKHANPLFDSDKDDGESPASNEPRAHHANFEADDGSGVPLTKIIAAVAVAVIVIIAIIVAVVSNNTANEDQAAADAAAVAAADAAAAAAEAARLAAQCQCIPGSQCACFTPGACADGEMPTCNVQSRVCTVIEDCEPEPCIGTDCIPGEESGQPCIGVHHAVSGDAGQEWTFCPNLEPEAAVKAGFGVDGPAPAPAGGATDGDSGAPPPPPPAQNCACQADCNEENQCDIQAFGRVAADAAAGDCLLMDDCSPTRVGGQCSAEAQGDQAWEMRTWTLCTNTFGYEAPAEDALAAETVMSYGLAGSTINRLGQAQTPAWEIYAASCGPARNGHSYCQGHSVFGSVLMYLCSGTPTDSSQSGSNGVVTCDWQDGTEVRYNIGVNGVPAIPDADSTLYTPGEAITLHTTGGSRFFVISAIAFDNNNDGVTTAPLVVKFRIANDLCADASSADTSACTASSGVALASNPAAVTEVDVAYRAANERGLDDSDPRLWNFIRNVNQRGGANDPLETYEIANIPGIDVGMDSIVLIMDFPDSQSLLSSIMTFPSLPVRSNSMKACAIYRMKAKMFDRDSPDSRVNEYSPIAIKTGTLDAETIDVDPVSMPGAVDPARIYDYWQFTDPVPATSLQYTCMLGAAATEYARGYEGASATLESTSLQVSQWSIYSAKVVDTSGYLADFGSDDCADDEVMSCTNMCVPVAFIGDGVCDNGENGFRRVNLNCPEFMFDEVDCW